MSSTVASLPPATRSLALVTTSLLVVLQLVAPARVDAQGRTPRIDFADHFHVRANPSAETRGDARVGLVQLEFVARVLDGGGGRLVVRALQGTQELARFACPVETRGRNPMTRCQSERLDVSGVDPGRPLLITANHVDSTTDAETPVYRGEFEVIRYWDWVGMNGNTPVHVEQRALRLDSALGVAIIRHAGYATSVVGGAGSTNTSSTFQFAFWDTRDAGQIGRATMRCRVGDGAYRAYRISGPGNWNDAQQVRNRVRSADGTIHEGAAESITHQHLRVSVYDLPFSIDGADGRLDVNDPSANGAWTCELRTDIAGESVTVRRFSFTVRGGLLVRHAASDALTLPRDASVVTLGFDARTAPAPFDPALATRGFYGMTWAAAPADPVIGDAPPASAMPSLTAPRGAAPQGGRPPRPTRRR